jgi:hypothetical protein
LQRSRLPQPPPIVNRLVLRNLDDAETYDREADGKTNREFVKMKSAVAPQKGLYGSTLASEFGPLKMT